MSEEQSNFSAAPQAVTEATVESQPSSPSPLEQLFNKKAEALTTVNTVFNDLLSKKFDRSDVIKVLYKYKDVLTVQDQLINITVNDLMLVADRFGAIEQQLFQFQQQLATLSTVLEDKTLVSKDDIKNAWETKVKPAIQAQLAKMQEKANELVTKAPEATGTSVEAAVSENEPVP